MELLGCEIPAGTTVATQAWSLHRNASVYPSPETYLPDRWLDSDEETLREMDAHLNPFGIGLRICAGMAFAQQDLRIVIATIARNFDVRSPPETNERTMEIRDAFVRVSCNLIVKPALTVIQVSFPAAMRCRLTLLPRKA